MNTITISRSDLAQMRFPSNNSVVIGCNKLTYDTGSMLADGLRMMCWDMADPDADTYTLEVAASKVETVSATGIEGKTIEEMFDVAVDYWMENNHSMMECVGGWAPSNSPAFSNEVNGWLYSLNETLRCQNADASDDDRFLYFVNLVGTNWVFDVCGFDRTMAILRKFFDTCAKKAE